MRDERKPIDRLLESLQERAKELNCLYQIEEILSAADEPLGSICPKLIQAIPPGWQYPDVCRAKITLENRTYTSQEFDETPWVLSADIVVQDMVVGTITVYYIQDMPAADDGPFLKEETRLISTIAERLGHFIMHQKMKQIVQELESARQTVSAGGRGEWRVVLDMLRQTDQGLYCSISRKMLNHLCWSGVREAEHLLQSYVSDEAAGRQETEDHWNRPHQRRALGYSPEYAAAAFRIAAEHLNDNDILRLIQKWVQEDKLSFLVQVVNRNLSLAEVADAIRRYHHLAPDEPETFSPGRRGIQVSLIRRFLSDQLQYINVAKNFIEVRDFYHLLEHVIFSAESHGKLGGKSAGLYLAAQILAKKSEEHELLANVRVPKTWHVTSDVLLHFMHYNNFDEVVEQKYKEINQVRLEYPHIVQTFKNARFPADIVKGLSVALDDFGERPLIVRSSSLLEDRVGAAFSGKYRSLFLANQGSKQKRLDALMDAIAEVYASTFSPDPIEYRAERGLLDFGEEMGIMIQEVVGTQVGHYFLPAYAGVAFSCNEFRWSPRINRKDGLVRLVPGLGTRAVDRLSDDYPVLIAPGQPGLRVNQTADEIYRYSPKRIDVINLETNSFETIDIHSFLKEVGYQYPALNSIVSVFSGDRIRQAMALGADFETDEPVVNFEGLIQNTPFVKQMHLILKILEEMLGIPVDVEFASDGQDFYLLQCRAQSYSQHSTPAPIPKDIPEDRVVFTANRYVSNGWVPDITHVVYVDPEKYTQLDERGQLLEVGRAISKLNKLLPKRQFILMGPGRWGSRGDIRLGVDVTYSDINNTAVLIEIARQKGGYLPDLSFGTHFFQDLVEAGIRYLPLYPDDKGILFNERFLSRSTNILADVLPGYRHLVDTIRLIDVPQSANGMVVRILMNADLDEAVAMLSQPGTEVELPTGKAEVRERQPDTFWRWRLQLVERIASQLDPQRFGVAGFYVFGSTKNATAGPASDIDVLVHFNGSTAQMEQLRMWLEGWSLCLSEINYMRTGYRTPGLLDVHIVTDDDIARRTAYAAKINAITDPARPLPMMKPAT